MSYKVKILIPLIYLFVVNPSSYAQNSKIKELENKRIQLKKEIKQITGLLIDNNKQTKMAYGGTVMGKRHMYVAGGSVKMNPGLMALRKSSPEAFAKITKGKKITT